MRPEDMKQGTDAWMACRCGKLTASRIADATAKTKSGWGASRANLMAQLAVERLTGQPVDTYTNAAIQHGIDTEPEARSAYEFYQEVEVEQVGFVRHLDIPMSGASPDGLIGGEGMVEIKCPQSATHIETLLGTPTPEKYIKQMQWQMACAIRDWCDFVSYDPRMPEALKLHVVRIHRDGDMIEELEQQARDFLAELDRKVSRLQELQEAA